MDSPAAIKKIASIVYRLALVVKFLHMRAGADLLAIHADAIEQLKIDIEEIREFAGYDPP